MNKKVIQEFVEGARRALSISLLFGILSLLTYMAVLGLILFLGMASQAVELKDYFNIINIFAVFGITFSIGLFTYKSNLKQGTPHAERIGFLSEASFVGTLLFVVSSIFFHAPLVPLVDNPGWLVTEIVKQSNFWGSIGLIGALSILIGSFFLTFLVIGLKVLVEIFSIIINASNKPEQIPAGAPAKPPRKGKGEKGLWRAFWDKPERLVVFVLVVSIIVAVDTHNLSADNARAFTTANEKIADSITSLAFKQRDILIEIEPSYPQINKNVKQVSGFINIYNTGTLPVVLDDMTPDVSLQCGDWNVTHGAVQQVSGEQGTLIFRPTEEWRRYSYSIDFFNEIKNDCNVVAFIATRHDEIGENGTQNSVKTLKFIISNA